MIKRILITLALITVIYSKNCLAIFSEHQDKIFDRIENNNTKTNNTKTNNTKTNNTKTIYLTFDACGGKNGSKLDPELIDFLIKNKIKSTLFATSRFLLFENNADLIKKLSQTNYFSIQNHGKNHRPASINGKKVYGIKGTESPEELREEVLHCSNLIYKITNKKPNWYRSGTAYYDSESITIINGLDFNIAGFTIAIDEGATLPKEKILNNILNAKNGDILLIHINRPEKEELRESIIKGLKILKKQNYKFEFLP